tara:strand:- start:444 stop:548 length:105 start_codon:yes stop_codon:yes gene_type:complete
MTAFAVLIGISTFVVGWVARGAWEKGKGVKNNEG